jgi:hypothetical protein
MNAPWGPEKERYYAAQAEYYAALNEMNDWRNMFERTPTGGLLESILQQKIKNFSEAVPKYNEAAEEYWPIMERQSHAMM